MGSAVGVLFFLMGEAHLEEGRALRQLVGLKSCPHSVSAQSACCRKTASHYYYSSSDCNTFLISSNLYPLVIK